MLQFPSSTSASQLDLFVMTPVEFIVSTERISLAQVQRQIPKSGSTIVLPTPSSGLSLNETGNWDEQAGYQHNLTKRGFYDYATKTAAKQIADQGGHLTNLAFKGEFINDYASLAYQGSNFREYSFSWILIPSSIDEAVDIIDIIKTIRYFSLPNYNKTDKGLVQYPYMWLVNPSIDSPIDMVLKDSVVTNFTVNYTPEEIMKTYYSGHPISVNMEITFKEIYRATDGDVLDYFGERK